jgi:hypothetical protein
MTGKKKTAKTKKKAAAKAAEKKPATRKSAGKAYELKTKPTEISVDAFIARVKNETRREDAKKLLALMKKATGEKPKMWGPSIVGFGSYHYKYESGHEGDMCVTGFSPRASALVVYILAGFDRCDQLLAKLGKHRHGKACLYINKLADIDLRVLEELVAGSLAYVRRKYPASS